MNTAIIVAAGSGQRFASSKPKQFIPILGRPLIIHTLERFEASPAIDEIVLVLSLEGRDEFARISGQYNFPKLRSVVTGGKTRAESVKNGLDAVEASTSKVVAVHDGARPLVSLDEIARTVEKAAEIGAACLVAEVTDTIKEIDGEHISGTIDRRGLRRALTPQAFRYDILRKAYENIDPTESVTDECSLVENIGVKIAFVSGSARNIKVTRPEDLILAEAYLKST